MRPRVILFNAVSVDGATEGFPVDYDTYYGIVSELDEDVTLAGCDTLLAATPSGYTEASAPSTDASNEARPLLAVVDSLGRLRSWSYWKAQPFWRSYLSLSSARTPPSHLEALACLGVSTFSSGLEHVDLAACLDHLKTAFSARTIRLESGGRLNEAMLEAALVDEVHLLVHPYVVGGAARPFWGRFRPERACPLEPMDVREVSGGCQLLCYRVKPGARRSSP